jgi:glycosyltransferase involved in cell wall biosynthesis
MHKDDFCELTRMSPYRVFVTPFAAAPGIFRPEPDAARITAVLDKHGIARRPYLLSLCTLEPRKNLPRLVRAFSALVEEERWRDLRLVLVGPADWKNDALFASLDERPVLRERVILPGFVPDGDLSALYSGARAFVFPSLYEGFGLPALEAMQCGVPVIASRTSAVPEVVGEAALTVDPADEGALSDAMRVVLSDTALAAELARLGLERSKQFTWDRTVEATVQAYGVMLAGS